MKIQKKKVHPSLDCLLASKQINFLDKPTAQFQIKGGLIIDDEIVM